MREWHFINTCEYDCQQPKALFAAHRVNRMIRLAGSPKAFPLVLDGRFYTMREEMQQLVDLARKRAARPVNGLTIKVGKAYRDVNGETRYVLDMPPRDRSFAVIWSDIPNPTFAGTYTRLDEFKEWALEEVI